LVYWFGVVPPILPTSRPFFYCPTPFSCTIFMALLDRTFGAFQQRDYHVQQSLQIKGFALLMTHFLWLF
jgi:hypothetical protein